MGRCNIGSGRKFSAFGLASLMALMAGVSIAHAEVQYNYVGPDFTMIVGPYAETTGLSTSDNITGYFDVYTPLAPNLDNASITPDSMVFTDGVNTYSGVTSAGWFVDITTDASGDITDWLIVTPNDWTSNGNSPQIVTQFATGFARDYTGALNRGETIGYLEVTGAEGTWTETTIPEPTTVALLTGSVGMLVVARRRRHRS